jgi:hypothetical protein
MGPLSLDNPLVQSAGLPLVIGFVVAGLLGFALGRDRGPDLAAAAIAIAFLAAFWAIFGAFPWPPRGSAQKFPYVAIVGVVLGIVFDLTRPGAAVLAVIAAIGGIAAGAWISGPVLFGLGWDGESIKFVVALVLAVIVLARLGALADRGAVPGIMLLMMAIAASIVALFGATASTSQLLAALGAGIGGFLLWNWPKPRFRFGAAALLGGAVVWTAMATQLALFTKTSGWALALLVLIVFADRLRPAGGRAGPAGEALIVAMVAMIPAAIAIALAYAGAR